jgi:hypothetical protein
MRIIAQINSEMAEGAERLAGLERQTALQQDLAQLTRREAAAVREALKAELGRERRRTLARDLAMVFLGAALSYVLARSL